MGLRWLRMHLWLDMTSKKDNVKNLCTKSMENCSLVVSQILAEWLSREGDIGIRTKLCKTIIRFKWSTKFTQSFCWVSKIAFHSRNPLHCYLLQLPVTSHCFHRAKPSRKKNEILFPKISKFWKGNFISFEIQSLHVFTSCNVLVSDNIIHAHY